jgi:hypothetical protein
MDRRWQLVLGCLGADKAPFSQGVLPQFRERIEAPLKEALAALRRVLEKVARFAADTCSRRAQRPLCTTAARKGRTVTIHRQEALLVRLRQEMKTPAGRAVLRQRTAVEHSLAPVGRIEGPRARHKGTRKNTLDVRRCATVDNLQTLARLRAAA